MNQLLELITGSFGALLMLGCGLLAMITAGSGGFCHFLGQLIKSERLNTCAKRSFQACPILLTLSVSILFLRFFYSAN